MNKNNKELHTWQATKYLKISLHFSSTDVHLNQIFPLYYGTMNQLHQNNYNKKLLGLK